MIFVFYFLCETFRKTQIKTKQNVQEGKDRTGKNRRVFCEKETFMLSNVGYEVYEALIHRPEDVLQWI